MKIFVLALVMMTLGLGSALWAGEEELSKAFDRCINDPNASNSAMVDCAQQELNRQDARLNAAYKKLMANLSKERQDKLREAQRAWIRFRDAFGDFLYDPEGGTIAQLNASLWHMQSTADRARQLEDAL